MKKFLLALFLLASCTSVGTTETPAPVATSPVVTTPTPVVETPKCKTPNFTLTVKTGPAYTEALELIKLHANSDEFHAYFSKKHQKFSHTDKTAIEAIRLFREQLSKCDTIPIVFYTPILKGTYIGNWDGKKISQNSKFILSATARARHLLHETSHKYGWRHEGNSVNKFDNVNSFPYAVGYAFEDYLLGLEAAKRQLAGGR